MALREHAHSTPHYSSGAGQERDACIVSPQTYSLHQNMNGSKHKVATGIFQACSLQSLSSGIAEDCPTGCWSLQESPIQSLLQLAILATDSTTYGGALDKG